MPRTTNVGCPDGFVRVNGEYCPSVQAECLEWIDPPDAAARRCRAYGPSTCGTKTVHRDFCMERTEHTEGAFAKLQTGPAPVQSVHQHPSLDSLLPLVNVNYWQARDVCRAEGADLCDEDQFEMACEGPSYYNYPTGQVRDCAKCNCDVDANIGIDFEHRVDHRKPVNEVAECRSGYGVESLVGNADEWVRKSRSASQYESVLRGGHWLKIRARCTPNAATTGHGPLFSSLEVGFRCCRDVSLP